MAKLSAHGNELARLEKRVTLDGGTNVVRTKVLMSDGVVLEKSTFLKPDGKVDFSDGWKRCGRWASKEAAAGSSPFGGFTHNELMAQGWGRA